MTLLEILPLAVILAAVLIIMGIGRGKRPMPQPREGQGMSTEGQVLMSLLMEMRSQSERIENISARLEAMEPGATRADDRAMGTPDQDKLALGLNPYAPANDDQIRKAYQAMVKRAHPDVSGGSEVWLRHVMAAHERLQERVQRYGAA